MNSPLKKKYTLGHHILFWAIVWLFYVFFFSYNSDKTNYTLALSTYLIPITAIATYGMVYRLIPKYLITKKYIQFGIYTFISFLFTTFCILLFLMVSVAFIPEFKAIDLPPIGRNYAFIVLLVYMVVILVSYASLWKRNSQIALANTTLQKELATAKYHTKEQELNYLKSQIHPHFLFNTLNTIYGMTLKKSEDSPDIILKLSSLLDYILYQTNKPEVSLNEELKHIEDYIDLEKMRFKDTLHVLFSKDITSNDVRITPMLLLPFIENAFKHGVIQNGKLKVVIFISEKDDKLKFNIKNTFTKNISKGGIGLKNIKERLELLYPENYNLQIDDTSELFEVNLKINSLKQNIHG